MHDHFKPRRPWRTRLLNLGIVTVAVIFLYHTAPGIPASAANTLYNSHSFELLSLYPNIGDNNAPDSFHGNRILGRITILDEATQRRIIRSLKLGARQHAPSWACFSPRHGIRVKTGPTTTDFVICFECHHVYVYTNGVESSRFDTSGWPESTFDDILKKAGIPLAPKAE